MTKKEILEMTGLSEQEFYQQYPTQEAFEMAMGGMVNSYKAQHYAQGGVVDVYQLMGMPTPEMYEMGGYAMMEDYGRGGMIKRKDGSYSKRGLWDNIRANKGSGRKPTKEMLKQERKIRAAEKKEYGGMVDAYGMGGTTKIGDLSHVISMQNHSNMGYAMGGAINYPQGLRKDMGNMPIFADGGMPEKETMPLKDKYNQWLKAKPTTKYASGGMAPHPEIGMDPSGTVPTKSGDINVERGESMWNVGNSQFIGTKAKTEEMLKDYNNRDLIALASKFNAIEREKAQKEAKDAQIAALEEQKAGAAMNRIVAKYGGAIKRMYAKGGMVPMYQGGATVNPFFQDITRNLQPSPFLQNLMQTPSASATLAPAARPYNSNVGMGAGLNTAVANYMGNNQFYQTGPNYTPTPTTSGNRSVRDMMSGLQPSPFLQRITEGVQPSPFLQRNSGRPGAQPTAQPSPATSAGMYNASRPTYSAPANTAAARPVGTRPATSARPTRPAFEPMTPMTMRGIDVNQLNPANPSSGYTDNFDMGNVGENERMYEPYGSSFELTGDELWGSSDATTIPGTGGELTADQLFGGSGNRNRGVGSNNQGTGAGMGNSQLDRYLMAAQFLPAAYNLGRGIFEKPWKPGSYETPANTKWEDLTGEEGRRGMLGAYSAAKYNARQLGGSNVLAGLQAGSSAYQRNLADYNEALENRNKLGRAEMNRFNKGIEQSNMQMRMNRDYLAQQAREKKAEMIGAGIGNIGSAAGQLWQNKQMMDALRMAYPNNTYTPNVSGGAGTAGTTSGQRSMFTPGPMTFREYNNIKNRRFSNSTNP